MTNDDWLYALPSSASDPDVQEALSRRYSNDIIMLLPLKSGKVAVMNCAREITGFVPLPCTFGEINEACKQPEPIKPKTINLEELGLL